MTGMFLGVGTGVFLIALVWIVASVLSILLSRTTGGTKFAIVPVLLLAVTVTLILLLFPRATEIPSPVTEVQMGYGRYSILWIASCVIVDKFFIGRYVLLALVSVVFLAALFMLLPLHFLEPVYAKPLRTH